MHFIKRDNLHYFIYISLSAFRGGTYKHDDWYRTTRRCNGDVPAWSHLTSSYKPPSRLQPGQLHIPRLILLGAGRTDWPFWTPLALGPPSSNRSSDATPLQQWPALSLGTSLR